jgi:hypothetical protein
LFFRFGDIREKFIMAMCKVYKIPNIIFNEKTTLLSITGRPTKIHESARSYAQTKKHCYVLQLEILKVCQIQCMPGELTEY